MSIVPPEASPPKIDWNGLALAAGAYGLWGVFPLFFKLLEDVAPVEIVAHRVLWAMLALLPTVLLLGRWGELRAVFTRWRSLRVFIASAAFVTINWLVFVYAILVDQVLQSSMGYFIFPLVTVALGVVVLGERLTRRQGLALILVGVGVIIMTLKLGGLPWIALTLAVSFSLYGLLRKMAPAEALVGLAAETILLSPIALGYILWIGGFGESAFGQMGNFTAAMLILSGPITALPLFLFAAAARRLRLATIGLMQFINPSMQFFSAVLLFGEPFAAQDLLSFVCIWVGLGFYAYPKPLRRKEGR
ncbi:MAG: EamA family transporter RarD [Magnetospiraceae bacterium]